MQQAIWMIAGGKMQESAAKHIKNLGYQLILSDGDLDPICRKYADIFFHIDTFDVPGHIEACGKLRNEYDIIGIMTVAADCHYTVNYIAKDMGLHHLDPEISNICRNKVLTRKLLSSKGIRQPKSASFSNLEDAVQWVSQQDNQLVVKATDNSGSRGFSIIEPNSGLTRDQFVEARRYGTTGLVMIEERLFPNGNCISESSVETLWQNGRMRTINWVDRIFGRDLKFLGSLSVQQNFSEGIEFGHINPAQRTEKTRREVEEQIEKAGLAIGMAEQVGAHLLKADIFFSTKGPIILELTPRCSGGWDSSGTSRARGAKIAEGVVHICQGKPITDSDWQNFFTFDSNINSIALARIPENAKNCIGREFKLFSGSTSMIELISEGIESFNLESIHV